MKAKKIISVAAVAMLAFFAIMMTAFAENKTVTTVDEFKAAIQDGNTIILGEDITGIGSSTDSTGIIIPANTDITLDLNGHNIEAGLNGSNHYYALNNSGTLLIKDSKGTGAIIARGIYNQAGGNLTIDGAKIMAIDYTGGACIWSYGGNVIINNATMIGYTGIVYAEGYLEINGGTYTCYSCIDDNGSVCAAYTYNIRANGGLKITDGTFTSRHGVISVGGGTGVIEGGKYTIEFAAGTTSNVVYLYGSSDLTINGGDFISDNSANKADSGAAVLVSGDNPKLTINGGNFLGMNGMVSGNSNTAIYAGTFNTVWNYNHYGALEPYVDSESTYTINDDGSITVTKKEPLVWTTDTDAGTYGDDNLAMMRFSFKLDNFVGEIEEVGIKYSKAENIIENVNAKGVSSDKKLTNFYGDIIGIDDKVADGGSYYAAAYIKTADGTIWSEIIKNSVKRDKHFTAYNPN